MTVSSALAPLLTWQVIAGTVLALSPITSYLDTVVSIVKRKSSAGFSLDVCAIMLISSICKVFFYFGRPYELSLFLQALVMIGIQVVLLKLALKHRPKEFNPRGILGEQPEPDQQRGRMSPSRFLVGSSILRQRQMSASKRPYAFWEWDSETPYWSFLIRLCVYLAVFQLLLGTWSFYIEGLGLVGLLIEAILPLPQIITIATRGSVEGFRPSLLVSWLGGDISKLAYLYSSDKIAPQFIICTILQGLLDLFIGFQYYMYTTNRWKGTPQASVKVSRQRAQSLKLQGVPNE
ncbi:hypothetical protein TRVA0_004S00474 [Trichomonascus vanleenenianus]|uniref:Any1p n=1 Tax=Trichomonascus vanleenenianus TaxID=2268995 RepID=UPI003ECAA992